MADLVVDWHTVRKDVTVPTGSGYHTVSYTAPSGETVVSVVGYYQVSGTSDFNSVAVQEISPRHNDGDPPTGDRANYVQAQVPKNASNQTFVTLHITCGRKVT